MVRRPSHRDGHGITLAQLRAVRDDVLRVATAYGASNVRVFGSVARGEARGGSDVDLLVDMPPDVHGFAYFGRLEDLRRALSSTLGCRVDVVDSAALRRLRERVVRDAVAL